MSGSIPYNIILRGETDARGQVTWDFEPPDGMVGRCLVRLVSFYMPLEADLVEAGQTQTYSFVDHEVRLLFGGGGYSYDSGVDAGDNIPPVARGVSQTLLASTNVPNLAPKVFRDIPCGPQRVTVEIIRNDTGESHNDIKVVLQLQIERI